MAANADAGNHSVQVSSKGQNSNSVNFFVQIPSKVIPFNHALAPNGIGPLHTPVNQPLRLIDGTPYPAPFDKICGVFRHYLFFLADQDNPPQEIVNRPFTLGEIFTNYSGPFNTPTFVPVTIGNGQQIGDVQSLFFFGTQCLQPTQNEQFDQQFKITFEGREYFPTTKIRIMRGNFDGTLKVDRTITTP